MRTTILVADDESSMRKYISSNLKVRGYEVIAAADGIEALKLLAEHPIDLVLLDIGMPGRDAGARRATARHPGASDHGLRARPRARQGPRTRSWGRRLSDQTVRCRRAVGAGARHLAACWFGPGELTARLSA